MKRMTKLQIVAMPSGDDSDVKEFKAKELARKKQAKLRAQRAQKAKQIKEAKKPLANKSLANQLQQLKVS